MPAFRISSKSSAAASATLAKRSVRLSHVFCDANEKFIGYPATGNRNEKFVVDYYTIVYFLTIAPQLAQKVVPGVESNMAFFDMRQTKEELETNFLMGGGGYKRAIENAYKTMSDTELRNALLQYEQWSYSLGRYYEDKQ